jgi:hypothetical protein
VLLRFRPTSAIFLLDYKEQAADRLSKGRHKADGNAEDLRCRDARQSCSTPLGHDAASGLSDADGRVVAMVATTREGMQARVLRTGLPKCEPHG